MTVTTLPTYVHGYSEREARRLADQAGTLAELIHSDTAYAAGRGVLEVGCGVGAQTVSLLAGSPGISLVAVDISTDSLQLARERVARQCPEADVQFHQGSVFDLPFAEGSFDDVFVCFVLEHLRDPALALQQLRRLLRPGGTITVVEGDHDSTILHPDDVDARAAVACQVRLQAMAGGDALLGRRLQPLLSDAGYVDVRTRPLTVYVDETRPDLVEGFTRNTFIALVAAARGDAVNSGLTTSVDWDRGIAALERAAEPGGVLVYTFFKATAVRPER